MAFGRAFGAKKHPTNLNNKNSFTFCQKLQIIIKIIFIIFYIIFFMRVSPSEYLSYHYLVFDIKM